MKKSLVNKHGIHLSKVSYALNTEVPKFLRSFPKNSKSFSHTPVRGRYELHQEKWNTRLQLLHSPARGLYELHMTWWLLYYA